MDFSAIVTAFHSSEYWNVVGSSLGNNLSKIWGMPTNHLSQILQKHESYALANYDIIIIIIIYYLLWYEIDWVHLTNSWSNINVKGNSS